MAIRSFHGTIYEVRIWNGAVSQRYISASALLGPSVVVTNLTPTSASLTVGPSVVITGTEQAMFNVTLPQPAQPTSGNRRRHELDQQQPKCSHGE